MDRQLVVGPNPTSSGTIRALVAKLESGETTATQLIETALDRIADDGREGARSFLSVAAERARNEASLIDSRRSSGHDVGPLAGIPVAVKDLADVVGEVTTAGSIVLADGEPAATDAVAVARLREAGCIVVGRTNMTEFAYSGLGLNSHFETPRSPWDRASGRIAGGSSSGSAVSVADGQVLAALGTDTGGSCRIPAAFCNVVGFKPTARRVPLDGIVPLSPSLDSVGPIANSVDCCAIVDDVFAGGGGKYLAEKNSAPRPVETLRVGLIRDVFFDGIDTLVSERFESALGALSRAGVTISEVSIPEIAEIGPINRFGGVAATEAFRWHQKLLETRGDEYDQRVRTRIEAAREVPNSYYEEVVEERRRVVEGFSRQFVAAQVDVLLAPTVAMVPPTVESFGQSKTQAELDYYAQMNQLALRNTAIGNFLDCCSISLPLCMPADRESAPAVGLMLMAPAMADQTLLATAAALEQTCRES